MRRVLLGLVPAGLLLLVAAAALAEVREGDLLVLDPGASDVGEVFLIDAQTGERRRLAPPFFDPPLALSSPESIGQGPQGWIYVTSAGGERVVRIDPRNGRRSVLSGPGPGGIRGSGIPLGHPYGIDVAPDGTVLAVEFEQRAVLAIDPETGDRSVVSSNSVGSGRGFGIGLGDPRIAALDPSGRLLVAVGSEYVYGVDPASGDRTVLTGPAPDDADLRFLSILDLAAEGSDRFLVVSNSQDAVFRVDAASGERSVVTSSRSGSPRGAGPAFQNPIGLTAAPDGEIFVADVDARAIVGVDPVSGDRRIVSGAGVGSGPPLVTPRRLRVARMPGPGAPGPLIGVDSLDFLYDVDPDTGFLIVRGQIRDAAGSGSGVNGFFIGIDRGPDGRLYGMTTSSRVWVIDPVTLEAETVAVVAPSPLAEGDIAFRPETGELYAVVGRAEGITLMRVDLDAGSVTTVAVLDLRYLDASAMVFRPDGLLAIIDTFGRRVLTVDPDSGGIVSIRSVYFQYPGGIGRIELAGALGGAVLSEDGSALLISAGNGLYSLPLDANVGTFLGELAPGVVVLSGLTRYDNSPPEADAGDDQALECLADASAEVVLDGSGSTDPDGDDLRFVWTGPFGTAEGSTPTVTLPLGTSLVTLEVTDAAGASDTDEVEIRVGDTTVPAVEAELRPLRGREHRRAKGDDPRGPAGGLRFVVSFGCSDACDPQPSVTATVDGLPVEDGDVYALRGRTDGRAGPPAPLLSVSCEDASGNQAVVEATPSFPPGPPEPARPARR